MYIALFIIGLLLGALIPSLIFIRKRVGTLLVTYDDNGDGPYLSLALDEHVINIINKKVVIMSVRQINRDY